MNQKIKEIHKKYNDLVFRCAISHLFNVGGDTLRSADVEAGRRTIREKGDTPLMTAEFSEKIFLCAVELAQVDIWEVLKFVQTDIPISDCTVHPGKIVEFRRVESGDKILTCVVSPYEDDGKLEEVEEILNAEKAKFPFGYRTPDAIYKALHKVGIRPQEIEADCYIDI